MSAIKIHHAPRSGIIQHGHFYTYTDSEIEYVNDRIIIKGHNHGHAILFNEIWVMHHDSDYAYKHNDTFYFFHNGKSIYIEQLPCDNFIKVMLKLKYTLDYDSDYISYV